MSEDPQHHFHADYRPDTASLPEARDDFVAWLGADESLAELRDEMLVVLSELLSNAIDASTDPEDAVAVRAWIDDGGLTLEVTNPASAVFDASDHWDYDDPLRPGGRGLIIVESLVDDMAIAPPDGVRPLQVRCRRAVPALH